MDNISQEAYAVPNFYTKANLLNYLLADKDEYNKVLIFVSRKMSADRLAEILDFGSEISVIHSSKEQNHRTRSIESFEDGTSRILIATDVIARGIDIEKISTVISFDTPFYPENYIHRIGRTGRAEQQGRSILFYSEKEIAQKDEIETLMNYTIPLNEFPEAVERSSQLAPEEKDKPLDLEESFDKKPVIKTGGSFHEKSAKNSKEKNVEKSHKVKLKRSTKNRLSERQKFKIEKQIIRRNNILTIHWFS